MVRQKHSLYLSVCWALPSYSCVYQLLFYLIYSVQSPASLSSFSRICFLCICFICWNGKRLWRHETFKAQTVDAYWVEETLKLFNKYKGSIWYMIQSCKYLEHAGYLTGSYPINIRQVLSSYLVSIRYISCINTLKRLYSKILGTFLYVTNKCQVYTLQVCSPKIINFLGKYQELNW